MGTYNKEKYYYFMLKSNFFDNDVLKYLQDQPNGYEMIILYFKLIFITINKDGYLIKKIGNKKIPYTVSDLCLETGHSESIVNNAIEYFLDTEMMEKKDGKLFIEDALILTNQTTVGAINMREYRIKNPDKCKPKCKNNCKPKSKVYIDNKNNNHNSKLITNNKSNNIEIINKDCQDVIDYLNYKTRSNFVLIEEYKKIISAVMNKYSINDIKTVIDKKTSDWINNPKMKDYLTPETLFGPKFERYLYQKEKSKTLNDISMEDIKRAKEMRDKANG